MTRKKVNKNWFKERWRPILRRGPTSRKRSGFNQVFFRKKEITDHSIREGHDVKQTFKILSSSLLFFFSLHLEIFFLCPFKFWNIFFGFFFFLKFYVWIRPFLGRGFICKEIDNHYLAKGLDVKESMTSPTERVSMQCWFDHSKGADLHLEGFDDHYKVEGFDLSNDLANPKEKA